MLIRIVRMTFDPAQVPAFLALFDATMQQIRQRPGCRHLELWQDANQPAIYCTHSHWDDAAALDAYRRKDWDGAAILFEKRLFAAPPVAFSSYVAVAEPGAAEARASLA